MLLRENNPWLGLESYQLKDSYRFFGREEEMSAISHAIKQNYCTVIYGKSGTGKTSLINAGLAPTLARDNFLAISIKLDHSEGHRSYCQQIIDAITSQIRSMGGDVENLNPREVVDSVPDPYKLWFFLHTNVFWSLDNHRIVPVLFIDQFEELFSLTSSKSEVKSFFNLVPGLLQVVPSEELSEVLMSKGHRLEYNEIPSFRMVLSLREDFLARLEDNTYSIPELRKNRIGLDALSGTQALDVILRPGDGFVTREVALKIISKISKKNCSDSPEWLGSVHVDTCILSLFCSELYNKAAELKKDSIDLLMVEETGDNIIQTFYEKHVGTLRPNVISYLENHLLTSNGYRNIVALEDIVPEHVPMSDVNYLENCRILCRETINGTERVEFTHDVLCTVADKHRQGRKHNNERRRIRIASIYTVIDLAFIWALYYLLFPLSNGCTLPHSAFATLLLTMSFGTVLHASSIYRSAKFSSTLVLNFLIFLISTLVIAIFYEQIEELNDGLGSLLGLYPSYSFFFFIYELSRPQGKSGQAFTGLFSGFMSYVWCAVISFSYVMLLARVRTDSSFFSPSGITILVAPIVLLLLQSLNGKETAVKDRIQLSYVCVAIVLLASASAYKVLNLPCQWISYLTLFAGVMLWTNSVLKSIFATQINLIYKLLIATFVVFLYAMPYLSSLMDIRSIYGVLNVNAGDEKIYLTINKNKDGLYGLSSKSRIVLPYHYSAIDSIYQSTILEDQGDTLPDFKIKVHDQYHGDFEESISSLMMYHNNLTDYLAKIYENRINHWTAENYYSRWGNAISGQTDSTGVKDITDVIEKRAKDNINNFNPDIYRSLAVYYASNNQEKAYAYACKALFMYISKSLVENTGIYDKYSNSPIQGVILYYYAHCTGVDYKKHYKEEFLTEFEKHSDLYWEIPQIVDMPVESIDKVLSNPLYHDFISNFIVAYFDLLAARILPFNTKIDKWMDANEELSKVTKSFAYIFMGNYPKSVTLSNEAYDDKGLIAHTNLVTALAFEGKLDESEELLSHYRDSALIDKLFYDGILQDLYDFERNGLDREYSEEIKHLRTFIDPHSKRREYQYIIKSFDWLDNVLFVSVNKSERMLLDVHGESLGFSPFNYWVIMEKPKLIAFGEEDSYINVVNAKGNLVDYPAFTKMMHNSQSDEEVYFAADSTLYVSYDERGILPLTLELLDSLELYDASNLDIRKQIEESNDYQQCVYYLRAKEYFQYTFYVTSSKEVKISLNGLGCANLDLGIFHHSSGELVGTSASDTDSENYSFSAEKGAYDVLVFNSSNRPDIFTLSIH